MDILKSIISQIPNFLLYVAPGYIFLVITSSLTYQKLEIEHRIISSIIVSFVITTFLLSANVLLVKKLGVLITGPYAFHISEILFTVVLAYIYFRFVNSTLCKNIFTKLKICRTVNNSIWADAIETGDWIQVYFDEDNISYYGLVCLIEEGTSHPQVVLSYYRVKKKGRIVEDYWDDDNTHQAKECKKTKTKNYALIDTAKCKRIEIIRPCSR